MFTLPTTVAKNAKSPEIKIRVGICTILLKLDLLISSSFKYSMISLLSSFHIKKTNISLLIIIFISSLSGLTIDSFKASYISLSQSI